MATLYERLGGELAITALAEILYQRLYQDDDLKGFFTNIEPEKMMAKQAAFLCDVFGGPKLESAVDLREVHRPLVARGLNAGHFDQVANHVKSIMEDMQVPQAEIDETLGAIASFKNDILDL